MIVGDPSVVNGLPFAGVEDLFDEQFALIERSQAIARLQILGRRPAFAVHPEGMLGGRAEYPGTDVPRLAAPGADVNWLAQMHMPDGGVGSARHVM